MSNDQGKSKPKRYHHGDLRNALITAGLELLSTGGAASLDMREVARKVGVSHAAPYRHFADKQALIAAINEEGFLLLSALMRQALAEASDNSLEQLQQIAKAYVCFADEQPWLMREMFSGMTIEREAYAELHSAAKEVYIIYVDVVQHGQERGDIIEGDPRGLAGVLWSMLHGVAMLIIENQIRAYANGPDGIARMTEFSIKMLYDGLARRP